MKSNDLLNALEEIDQNYIDDAMPEKCRTGVRRAKFRRVIVTAACFVVMVCGVLASRPFWNGNINPPVTDHLESGKNSNENDVNSSEECATEAGYAPIETGERYDEPTECCTEVCEPTLVTNYLGEQYQKYSFTSLVCDESTVGEKIDEIVLNCNWSDTPDKVIECKADVFEVVGRDGEVSLCYKFSDDVTISNTEEYYYLNNYSYSFESLEQMAEMLGLSLNMRLDADVSYVKKSEYCYCDRYTVFGDLSTQLAEVLFSSESERIEDRSLYYTSVHQVAERVTLYFVGNGLDIYFEVLSNGYVYCSSIGAHLFDIGAERAQKIIDLVKQGEPVGYVWNEEHSEWYTICEEDEIRENPPKTFQEMLELRDVYNTSFHSKATYIATKIKPAPPYFTLDKATYAYIVKFVFELDGDILSPEEVPPAYECVKLTFNNGSDRFEMHVFSAGYISFGGFDYFVGVAEVEKLISVVVFEGNPAPGYYWDEGEWCWKIGDSNETYPPAYGTQYDTIPIDTAPAENIEDETFTDIWFETETVICEEFVS